MPDRWQGKKTLFVSLSSVIRSPPAIFSGRRSGRFRRFRVAAILQSCGGRETMLPRTCVLRICAGGLQHRHYGQAVELSIAGRSEFLPDTDWPAI